MKQFLNILLAMTFWMTACQPVYAQQKIRTKQITGDMYGNTANNTDRIVLPKDTKTNLDALTRKEGNLLFDTVSKKPYFDNGTALQLVGSGGGGGINLITDGDAEGTNPFTAYKDAATDAPTDGTGGTPSFVSVAISSTTPLAGLNSFVVTKAFGNPIGEGVSVPFTVQPAYKARMLKISFDYSGSAGFTPPYSVFNSDITVWIYDVTAGKLIQPSNFQIMSNNGTFQADFQSDAASTNYRLILHTGTVNTTAWTFKADNFSVAPSQYVYAPVVTDWQTFTPTGSWTANSTYAGKWRRVGDSAEYMVKVSLTGAPNALALTINLPNTIDTSKITSTQQYATAFESSGMAYVSPSGYALKVAYNNSSSVSIVYVSNGTTSITNLVTQSMPVTWATGNEINIIFKVPILGWTSSTQVSDGYDARDLRVNVLRSTNLTGLNPNNTSVKIPIAPTTIEDTYSGWDAANNRVTIKSAKNYDISYGAWIESTNVVVGQYYIVQLMKNGVEIDSSQIQYTSVAAQFMRLPGGKKSVSAVAGDYFEVFIYSSANQSVNTLTARRVWLDVQAVQAPTTISATELISADYSSTSGNTIGVSDTLQIYGTKVEDTHGAYNSTTGIFTAPTAGSYRISVTLLTTAVNLSTTQAAILSVYKNGTFYRRIATEVGSGTSNSLGLSGSVKVILNAGETLSVYAASAVATTQFATTGYNFLTIERVK